MVTFLVCADKSHVPNRKIRVMANTDNHLHDRLLFDTLMELFFIEFIILRVSLKPHENCSFTYDQDGLG